MEIKIVPNISDIGPEAWATLEDPNFPFQDYGFYRALELGGCLGPGRGWTPFYLSLWEEGKLLGAVVLFEKLHSFGEFIFDWEWAQFSEQSGLPYYPKGIAAAPFTPATGGKILTAPGTAPTLKQELLKHAWRFALERNWSGLHFLFITPEEIEPLEAAGFHLRHSYQFHWHNPGYENFEAFLQTFKRKRRQSVIKSRREIVKQDIELISLEGEEIQMEHLQLIHGLYLNTMREKLSEPYLNRTFFESLKEQMGSRLLLHLAKKDGHWIAGSINFFKGENLFGRYWGAVDYFPFLHFELCYHQNIEFAISRGMKKFEAGAQGGHKIFRGLIPQWTYSTHRLRDPHLDGVIAKFLIREQAILETQMKGGRVYSPFKGDPTLI